MSNQTGVPHLPPGARGLRLDDTPTVSVVVAVSRGADTLRACLENLSHQCFQHRAEIVVAGAVSASDVEHLGERYPAVRWVLADANSDITHLRGLGLAAAKGDIVALTEDHMGSDPNWVNQILHGLRRGPAAEASPEQPKKNWTAYFAGHDHAGPA